METDLALLFDGRLVARQGGYQSQRMHDLEG